MVQEELSKKRGTSVCPTAIIVKNGNILLGLRNYTADKWKKISVWTTPGGRSDENESIEQALRREVKEEIGITDLEIKDFIAEAPGAKDGDIVPIFFCTTKQEPQLLEPEKFSEWRWVPISDYMTDEKWSAMNPAVHRLIREFVARFSR